MSDTCRFCRSTKLLRVNAKTSDLFSATMPGRRPSNGYNFVPGLMEGNSNDYIEATICLGCQRVQKDLFDYVDKKSDWTLQRKLSDLAMRAARLLDQTNVYLEGRDTRAQLAIILEKLAEVDRCLPGLVRELEQARSGKVYIDREAASAAELMLARTMPDNYEII